MHAFDHDGFVVGEPLLRLIAPTQPDVTLGALEWQPKRWRFLANGRVLPLRPMEYRLMALMTQRFEQVITYAEFARVLPGADDHSGLLSLRVQVRRIKDGLSAEGVTSPHIHNVRGVGYEITTEPASFCCEARRVIERPRRAGGGCGS